MSISSEKLAIDGGTPVRTDPFPPRRLISEEEKSAAIEVFDESIEKGEAFGYIGRRVYLFEREFADFLGGGYAKAVNSGTSAVLTALAALELEPCSEVICPPISDPGGVMPIVMMNCIPVPADTNEFSFNTGPEQVAAVITERTRAILVAQIMGEPVDIAPILDIAHKRGIYVIEDAAQALGSKEDGRGAGTFGRTGCFSFFPTKNLGGYGDGGMVVTGDPEVAERIRRLRVHGCHPKFYHSMVGINGRLDEIQAAVLLVKLRYLDEWIQRRRDHAIYYDKLFRSLDPEGKYIVPPSIPEKLESHVFNQYCIRVVERDSLRDWLRDKGIGSEIYYPLPLHLQECFKSLGYRRGDLPEAERAANEILAIPVYPELDKVSQETIVDTIGEFYGISR